MYCNNCGRENELGARFCTGCGSPLENDSIASIEGYDAQKAENFVNNAGNNRAGRTVIVRDLGDSDGNLASGKNVKHKKLFITIAVILLAVLVAAGAIVGRYFYNVHQWNEYYDSGQKYLTEAKYDEAVTAFTNAINIDKKKPLAYIGRGDAYTAQADTMSDITKAIELYKKAGSDYDNAKQLGEKSAKSKYDDVQQKITQAESGMEIETICANVNNGGRIAIDGDGYYAVDLAKTKTVHVSPEECGYSETGIENFDTEYEISTIKSSDGKVVAEDAVSCNENIVIGDKWIYYLSYTDERNSEAVYSSPLHSRYLKMVITRVKKDGSGREQLKECNASRFFIYGNQIFFTDNYTGCIYKSDLNGKNKEILVNLNNDISTENIGLQFEDIALSGDNLYFSTSVYSGSYSLNEENQPDEGIWKVNIDGKNCKQVVSGVYVDKFIVYGNSIYYYYYQLDDLIQYGDSVMNHFVETDLDGMLLYDLMGEDIVEVFSIIPYNGNMYIVYENYDDINSSYVSSFGKYEKGNVNQLYSVSDIANDMVNEQYSGLAINKHGFYYASYNNVWKYVSFEESNSTNINDTAWKTEYIKIINECHNQDEYTRENAKYALINVNGDNIPELYVDFNSTAGGSKIIGYSNGSTFEQWMYVSGLSYIQGKNIFKDSGGHMDEYYDKIYEIKNGVFSLIADGEYGAEDNSRVQYDEEGFPIYDYYWNQKEVSSEDEYNKCLKAAFNEDKALRPDEKSYDQIIQEINNY